MSATGKVLLVTGAGRGIGAATARLGAAAGYSVCVNYARNTAAAEAVVRTIEAAGGHAVAHRADVANEAEVIGLFERVDAELGTLDALVNNAGILLPAARVEQMNAARLAGIFATNVVGCFTCAREAIKRMSTVHGGKGGAIVNVSSVAARLGGAGAFVDYAATKGALNAMTLGLAREVAKEGIRVNAVLPGLIDTEIHGDGGDPDRPRTVGPSVPIGRAGTPEEVAEAILWLLSDKASYVAGALVDVSAGR